MGHDLHWHGEWRRSQPLFFEWVYLKFTTPDLDGILVFESGWGTPGEVALQFFPKGGAPVQLEKRDYTLDDTWRSHVDHRCRFGDNEVLLTPTGYATHGHVEAGSHRVVWNLDYARVHPQRASFQADIGFPRRADLSWDLLAPLARVRGAVTLDGVRYAVDGHGYADTNYGHWLFAMDPGVDWNWLWAHGEALDSRLCLVGMNLRRTPEDGRLYVMDEATQVEFPTDARTFEHVEWQPDAQTGVQVPVRTRMRARAAGYTLDVEARNVGHHVYRQPIPPAIMRHGLPTLVEWDLLENFVTVEGTLTHPDGRAQVVKARGIKEYPTSRLWPRTD